MFIEIKNLHTYFHTDQGLVKSIQGVNFSIPAHSTTCLVGESGSGKSVTALSMMGLLPKKQAEVVQGEILFDGQDLLKMSPSQLRQMRGREMAMIFQEPMTSLNPGLTIGYQIQEALKIGQDLGKKESRQRALDLVKMVDLPRPEKILKAYPHQLSGGQRQRVMIAMGLANKPKLLIADEPTTALDVTIQAQVLCLLDQLKKKTGTAILLITHDLGVVAEMADYVVVMFHGRVVERGTVFEIFDQPAHPYTRALLAARPSINIHADGIESHVESIRVQASQEEIDQEEPFEEIWLSESHMVSIFANHQEVDHD
ncbi:Glutathione import ATP-binding protein GsiA [Urinicoccus massiliensis]|uniref:Glutathione import ATP-binding protein GsiA n=1 Tax=Urinicoccus massiliensis TaxID=1723382 RepID=A0A8H2M4B3_9FIRM|nr:ABC transporter ATP-binding protein [Urinicoccus massiliensis]VFB15653.1 Glutathione import ATP-binding protein GsiA [Urinicoccus massiliensis]